MKILALDSSGLVASVAVVEDNQLLAEYTVNYKKTHSQTLLPMLDEIAKMIELDLETIDAIAVAAGPGSFTGLRIGSATAKGLGLALKKPLIPVPTVDALAYNLYDSTGVICPMMDARRKQVYTGIYRFADHELVTVSRQKAIAVEELIGEILKRIDAERAESPGENNDIQIYKRALTKAWERLGYPGELARVRTDLVYTSEADDLEWLAERAKDGQIRKEKRAQVYKVIGDVRRKQGQTEAAFQNYLEALRQNGSGFVRTELSRIFLTDLYEGSKRAAVYAKAGDASEFLNQWLGKYGSIEEIQQLVKECL